MRGRNGNVSFSIGLFDLRRQRSFIKNADLRKDDFNIYGIRTQNLRAMRFHDSSANRIAGRQLEAPEFMLRAFPWSAPKYLLEILGQGRTITFIHDSKSFSRGRAVLE